MLRSLFLFFATGIVSLQAQPVATVQITRTPQGAVVPRDFLGLSIQQSVASKYFGPATASNGVLFTLLKNLGAGTLRIGGAASDSACWAGEPAPLPSICQYTLPNSDFDSWAYASTQTGWPMIVGVSLAQNAAPGAPQYILDEVTKGLLPVMAKRPRAVLAALELGNELNLYSLNSSYRPPSYDVPAQIADLLSYITAFKGNAATQNIPLAGPAYFNPSASLIASQVDPLVAGVVSCAGCNPTNLGLVTLHEYAINTLTGIPTIAQLLSPTFNQRVESTFKKAVTDMRSLYKLNVQIDETNSAAPDPGVSGVSDVQAAALWALDFSLDMANQGVRRINFHIHDGSFYVPISVTWTGPGAFQNQVQPEYYAMYAFNAAKNQQFLPLTVSTTANIRAYALSTCATCPVTVYLINKDLSASGTVQVHLSSPGTNATYLEMAAPSLTSGARDVFFGGVQFNNATGTLSGGVQNTLIQPDGGGTYTVNLDNAAAGILVIQP